MVALVVVSALLVIPVAVIEGGREAKGKFNRWRRDRKLFKQLRRSYT